MKTIAYDHQIFSNQRFGGISRYICEIAERAQRRPDWNPIVIAPVHYNDHLADSTVRQLGSYFPIRVPILAHLYRAANAVVAPFIHAATRADLLHRTYYSCSTRPHGAKIVVTVHDMIHEIFPEHFSSRDRTSTLKRRAIAEADAVLCNSWSTAIDLQRLLDVPSEKIAVTQLGYSTAFAAPQLSAANGAGQRRPFLLFVGQRARYKNFAKLLRAYAASSRLARDFDLVAFGGSPFSDDEQADIKALKLRPDSVRLQTGRDSDLAHAYAGARALVYPSEYEGFGIPLLEAMSAGCPVICSNTSSLPEVALDAAEYFDPRDVESIRAGVERVVYDEQHRDALIARGRARCMDFSWDRCAEETFAVYQRLLS